MRIPPEKPHFFQFIRPNLKDEVKIPISFFKYLNGEKLEQVMLRRGHRNWAVKINGRLFEDGWAKFVEENGVEECDFVVFRYEGNMVFHVMLFDPTHCEKQYTQSHDDDDDEVKAIHITSPAKEITPKPHKLNRLDVKNKPFKACLKAKTAISTPDIHPYFVSTLLRCHFRRSILYLPIKFARSNCLRKGEMILRDGNQRSWPVELREDRRRGKYVYIGHGWSEFRNANDLKEGDVFKFELIENGKKPVVNFFCNFSGGTV